MGQNLVISLSQVKWSDKLALYKVNAEEHQAGWNIGFCQSCGQIQAAQVVRREAVGRFVGVESYRRLQAELIRCDFCERELQQFIAPQHVPLQSWRPQQGMAELCQVLSIGHKDELPPRYTEQSLNSLLSATGKASTLYRGITMFGFVVSILLSMGFAIYRGMLSGPPQNHEEAIANRISLLVSFILFLVINFGFALWNRERIARSRLARVFNEYDLNIDHLANLASRYPRRIRRAVSKLQ